MLISSMDYLRRLTFIILFRGNVMMTTFIPEDHVVVWTSLNRHEDIALRKSD